MDVGDLLKVEGGFWVVRRVEPSLGKAVVEDQDAMCQWQDFGALVKLKRLCNPVLDWPSATMPSGRHDRLLTVLRDGELLIRFKDWFRVDEFQMGGLLYLNPALGMGFRDRLTVTYADGVSASVNIPKVFRPASALPAPVVVVPKPPPVSLLDRLLLEGDDE